MPTPIFGDDYVICITQCKVEIRLGMKTTKNIKTAITEPPSESGAQLPVLVRHYADAADRVDSEGACL